MVAGGDHGGGRRHQLAGLHGGTDGAGTIVSSAENAAADILNLADLSQHWLRLISLAITRV